MDVLILSRASGAAAGADDALNERHWSYMDGHADRMTARGPTLNSERDAWTGSLHVVDLPVPDAARAFVAEEPYQRAGLFAAHRLWRFTNLLGRTMWEYAGPDGEPRFLVLVIGTEEVVVPPEQLIVHGRLSDLDTDEPVGSVLAAQAPSRAALDALLTAVSGAEVHDWEFGGRR